MLLRQTAALAFAAALLGGLLLGCADNGTATFVIEDADLDGIEDDLDDNDDDANAEFDLPGDTIPDDGAGDGLATYTPCAPGEFVGCDDNCRLVGNPDQEDADLDGYDSDQHGGDDCDDMDDQVNPGASELDDDGIDSDCDGNDNASTTGTGTGTATGTATGTGTGNTGGGGGKDEDKACNSTGTAPAGWGLMAGLLLAGIRRRR